MSYYISKLTIENIRCFSRIQFEFYSEDNSLAPWALLLGDNSSGKSTILRCIALGLCDQSSAAGLLRESEAGWVRHGKSSGLIAIELTDDDQNKCTITTKIETLGGKKSGFEQLTQAVESKDRFPWSKIFVCGYGAGRGVAGSGDLIGYSPINATYNLFNYSEGLQNPELFLRRTRKYRNLSLRTAERFMGWPNKSLSLKRGGGLRVKNVFGPEMPIRDLSDGYRSSFLWFSDFLGWASSHYVGKAIDDFGNIRGIILIDELEQHLHPAWQRRIVNDIRKALPNIQFITTSHSPLIAAGMPAEQFTESKPSSEQFTESKPSSENRIFVLMHQSESTAKKSVVPTVDKVLMRPFPNYSANNVLTSQAFGLNRPTAVNPTQVNLAKYLVLYSSDERTPDEEDEFKALGEQLKIELPSNYYDIEFTQIRKRATNYLASKELEIPDIIEALNSINDRIKVIVRTRNVDHGFNLIRSSLISSLQSDD